MYISIIVYALLVAMLFWGGKCGGISSYNDDFMSREATLSVRGLAALGVLLHHISQEKAFQNAKCLSIFTYVGYLFVAVFFFCSGYGLVKSFRSKKGYLASFMQKRLPVLIVPFYVNTVLYGAARFFHGDKMPLMQWIACLSGLSLMNRFAWYVVVIVILYVVFYAAYRNVKNDIARIAIITAAVLLQGAAFLAIGHFAWWAGEKNWWLLPGALQTAPWWKGMTVTWFHGEWWVNSSIAFPLGIAFATYEESIVRFIKKHYWPLLVLSLAAAAASIMFSLYTQYTISYWSEFSGKGYGFCNKAICYAVQLLEITTFTAALFILLMKFRTINPITRLFGGLSLETYLMQPFSLMLLAPISKQEYLALYIVSNIVLTVVLAEAFKRINSALLCRFKGKKA